METEDELGMLFFEHAEDEQKYREWLSTNPTGFVLNCYFYPNGDKARLHGASCWTLTSQNIKHTDDYAKKCSCSLPNPESWAATKLGPDVKIVRCSKCL